MSAEYTLCPKSAISTHDADKYGFCIWCGRKVTSAVPKPDRFDVSELTDAYGEYYDPDYGVDRPRGKQKPYIPY